MDGSTRPESGPIVDVGHVPRLVIRAGRGRTGGSTGLDLAIQRARHFGRRVKPLDGDLRSRTLSELYPSHDPAGKPIEDGASAPKSDELPDIKVWLSAELDEMVETGVSRALDLSGGDRVIQEYVRDLALADFCRDFGVDMTFAVYLGPDMEDFRHATQLLTSGEVKCERTLLVLNEGVIRQGQTTTGAFDGIVGHSDFLALLGAGARSMFLRRLTCMAAVRERGLRFYDLLDRSPGAAGEGVSPTLHHMTKAWLAAYESALEKNDVREWMP
jgi:hypothetical protein